jgi:ribosomal protein L31E
LEQCKKDEKSIDRYKRAVKRKLDVDGIKIDTSLY